jgi:SAM-dependent methyltransferase
MDAGSMAMDFLGRTAERLFFRRRSERLADAIAPLLPQEGKVLDVGCGDGLIDQLLQQRRPDVALSGVDVMVRPEALVPVVGFDGATLPFSDGEFDAVMLIDVLHHTTDPLVLLREAMRVSRGDVILKDHTRDGFLAGPTLSVMDWLGNAHHDIPLPYCFWTEAQWRRAFRDLGLHVQEWNNALGQYPFWLGWITERRLHMVTRLTSSTPEAATAGGSLHGTGINAGVI